MDAACQADSELTLRCQVRPADIDLFNKLLAGYDHLAYVTTDDPALGRLTLRCAASAQKELRSVLRHLPCAVEVLD